MDNAKTQLAEKIKSANNILVTVSRNPSVDQLAACIGLALLLNKIDKHTAAVFSGQVPSTLEFLKPEETLEKNTDSLRDFIIALDKSKADKLRYKVEDDVVRIFITPYRTSISQADLEFSQGDFNVDLVIALGVRQQEDLDQAITVHGRILHDATVASITTSADSGLGSINWHDQQASSLSELVTDLAQMLGPNVLDNQIATALLTGIVAETNRFSNDKTSSQTMSASAALMTAGANQQLVASKLEETSSVTTAAAGSPTPTQATSTSDNDTLDIDHEEPDEQDNTQPPAGPPMPSGGLPELPPVDDGSPPSAPPIPSDQNSAGLSNGAKMITEPPSLGGMLNANTKSQPLEPSSDPLSLPAEERPLLGHNPPPMPAPEPVSAPAPVPAPAPMPAPAPLPVAPVHPPAPLPPGMSHPTADIPQAVINSEPTAPGEIVPEPTAAPTDSDKPAGPPNTLTDIEASVHSPHLNTARDEVSQALNSGADSSLPTPIQALNAQPLGDALRPTPTPPPAGAQPAASNAPPPVPPPIPFQFGSTDGPPM